MSDRQPSRRERLHAVIFEAETPAGKVFDVALLAVIVTAVVLVMLESIPSVRATHGPALVAAEWVVTVLFTLEYVVRLVVVRHAGAYARSFFGVVDVLAIVPTYLSLVVPGSQSLLTIRALRLLRIFRVFKLARFLGQANVLTAALRSSGHKVAVFLGTVFILVVILGSAMYLIEGEASGFTSIPESVYWAIVTVTTVGYGDLAPVTPLGKALAAVAMVMGYSIIVVPTGIVSAELVQAVREPSTRVCPECLSPGHENGARYCKDCGRPVHGLKTIPQRLDTGTCPPRCWHTTR